MEIRLLITIEPPSMVFSLFPAARSAIHNKRESQCDRTRLSTPVLVTSLCLASAIAIAAGSSIQVARDSVPGTIVTVEGVVSVPSGALAPNDEGFAIQSGNHGIYIHDSLGGTTSSDRPSR